MPAVTAALTAALTVMTASLLLAGTPQLEAAPVPAALPPTLAVDNLLKHAPAAKEMFDALSPEARAAAEKKLKAANLSVKDGQSVQFARDGSIIISDYLLPDRVPDNVAREHNQRARRFFADNPPSSYDANGQHNQQV